MDFSVKEEKVDSGKVWWVDGNGLFKCSLWIYDKEPTILILADVFVIEEERGKGYGSTILGIAEEAAKEFLADMIFLTVDKGSWMEAWYRRHGYETFEGNAPEGMACLAKKTC